ncbi:B3 domain-containing protein REM20-like [Salvia divinorum]|uniref:B3 domain-containing protein REM20-like n=1 Tax=Salvia divinorum TaxID=28513 RepID=A0ABD1FW63_SALDI
MAAPSLNDGDYARYPSFFKRYSRGLHNSGI